MSNILPFGTSADAGTVDGENSNSLNVIKAFGCTVVTFNVSADWGGQGGQLDLTLIEDDSDGDRLSIPVIGSPFIFEVTENDSDGNTSVIFEYVGVVSSFSRSASTSTKTYSAAIASPLKILDATKVIMNGYTGLGGSLEGDASFTSFGNIDFGSRNADIEVMDDDVSNYASHWFNVSNLVNVFGILENDHANYRVPFAFDGDSNKFGDFGYSAVSADGIPLVKLMWALHMGINHMPKLTDIQRQQTHGGNLLYGRHNYDINGTFQGIPYFYDFDALGFYNQIKNKLGPEFRVPGDIDSLNNIISQLCNEANFEYLIYIDIHKNEGFGDLTLREDDPNWNQTSNCSWKGLDEKKFTDGGKYGGTIRVQTIDKNSFFNPRRPFSNISYNLLGLEVPDLIQSKFSEADAVHPGKRPGQPEYGLANNNDVYMDPLDSEGLDGSSNGFTEVGTQSLANGGSLPTTTGLFDNAQMSNLKITNSSLSLTEADTVTMKVVTGGYQSRIVSVPRSLIKHYWGDIQLIGSATDPRTTNDTATDQYGLNQTSVRKIPVVTQLLDPRDVDDFIFIDMQSIFGNTTIEGVLQNGVYAASVYEIRCAMKSLDTWKSFFKNAKVDKSINLQEFYFSGCLSAKKRATGTININGGLAAKGVAGKKGATSPHLDADTSTTKLRQGTDAVGIFKDTLEAGGIIGDSDSCRNAVGIIATKILPKIHEKVKAIGDTHYGKSWYVPVPYLKTKFDLNGENLVGDFTRSWNLESSAYVEPSLYYIGEIPQTNEFIQDGKVSPFVNYDNDFIYSDTGRFFDDTYVSDLTSPINGVGTQVFNFSEYQMDQLATTKYGDRTITHAAPQSISDKYSFLPYAYDTHYNRSIIPYTDIDKGKIKTYNPSTMVNDGDLGPTEDEHSDRKTTDDPKMGKNPTSASLSAGSSGSFVTDTRSEVFDALNNIKSLGYPDNGEFCFPFVKVETSRVFMPVIKNSGNFGSKKANAGFHNFFDFKDPSNFKNAITSSFGSPLLTLLKPFPVCVCPRSINYAQRSTRYVYGPWITNISEIAYRGNIEYEQDDSLVPENFLIPLSFGEFGDFQLNQISGLTGLNLAAQGRANAIDDFALFAQEQGSITIQAPPAVKRIGDSLYGVQQVSDVKVSVNNNSISTTYSFKTISPKFGKNNKDVEKRLTKISNAVKKMKLI